MKPHVLFTGIAALLLLTAHPSFALDNHGATKDEGASVGSKKAAKKAAPKIKLVDINSASKQELIKLPGVSEADADKIVAGRPYGSKAWLVSNQILSDVAYEGIRKLIIAKQPYKDGAKNAALYKTKK